MTYIVPVTAGATGYAAAVASGHPTTGIFVGLACAGVGFIGRFGGHGFHLNRGQMRKVTLLMHRSIAANWAIRPLAQRFTDAEQQKLVGSIFDAVAGEPIQDLVEQWPIIWAHVQRVHFSGIPPLASLRAMRRAYRPGLFGKDKGKARDLAQPVVDAYAMLHPSPDDDRDWFMRWSAAVGLPEQIAHQMWADAMNARGSPAAARTAPAATADVPGEAPPVQPRAQTPRPRPQASHLSDAEIERRLAASRA